jgi:hypothetical protein
MRDNPKWHGTLSKVLWRQPTLYEKSRAKSSQAICQSPVKDYWLTIVSALVVIALIVNLHSPWQIVCHDLVTNPRAGKIVTAQVIALALLGIAAINWLIGKRFRFRHTIAPVIISLCGSAVIFLLPDRLPPQPLSFYDVLTDSVNWQAYDEVIEFVKEGKLQPTEWLGYTSLPSGYQDLSKCSGKIAISQKKGDLKVRFNVDFEYQSALAYIYTSGNQQPDYLDLYPPPGADKTHCEQLRDHWFLCEYGWH